MDFSQIWWAEYSEEQDCFHVDTMDVNLKGNARGMVHGPTNGYVPFFASTSQDEAHNACEAMREIIWKRRHPDWLEKERTQGRLNQFENAV